MIVMDGDRGKPIQIRQSLLCRLLGLEIVVVLLMLVVLPTASEVGKIGAGPAFLHIFGMIAAHPWAFLLLVGILVGPSAFLVRRWCWWCVDVSDGVLIYRSLFRRRAVPTADIVRVAITGRTSDGYKLILRDGTAIRMDDVALGSKLDLARFEDEVVCRIPQIEVKRRLFTKIRKRGYTEYL